MDRCALFVDAGYALGNGAFAVHGTPNRDSVSWDYAGLLKLLGSLSRDRTGLPLLRCYWYDVAPAGSRVAEHDALADLPAVKVRLGGSRPGRSEGVGAEIRKDLTTLARNGAVSDVVIVSAAEDLAPVIAEVQEYGLRTLLLHYGTEDSAGWRALRQEFDEVIEISATHLRPFVELIAGAEPRYSGAGYRELPAGAQVSAAQVAIEAPAARLLAPAAPDGYGHADQLPVMNNQRQDPRELLPRAEAAWYPAAPRDEARGPQADDGRATRGPAALPQSYPAAEAGGPGSSTAAPSGYGQASFGHQGEAHAANGHGGAGQATEFSERGRTAGAVMHGGGRSGNADDQSGMAYNNGSAGVSSAQPGTGLQPGNGSPPAAAAGPGRGYPADDRAANGSQAAGPRGHAAPAGHEFAAARLTPPGLPGHGSPGNGQPAGNGLVPGGLPAHATRPADPNEGAMGYGGHGHSGPHPAVSAQAFRPAGSGTSGQLPQPPSGQPAQRDSLAPPDPQRPPVPQRQPPPANGSPYGQDRGAPYSSQPQQSSQVATQQAFGSGSYAATPPSMGDAVQSAHAEGYGFGEAVARDAPALWLEAVLARKPRMPSDLEARLLQGSALPIDSLLHDEVRHALRRGFWDALERSRH